jgi:superfamily I DNA/RNA helicase
MKLSKSAKIVGAFIIAVPVVFALLLLKVKWFPPKPHPQITQELLQPLQRMGKLDELALTQIGNRLSVIAVHLEGAEGTEKYIKVDLPIDANQRESLVETVTSLKLEWAALKSQDDLNQTTITELQTVIKGLQLGEQRDHLTKTLDMLAQGIEIQKTGFPQGDLALSSLISNVQLLRSQLDGIANQADTATLRATLEGMTLSVGTAVRVNEDQKDDVLGNEVTLHALRKVVDDLPLF